MLHWLLHGSPSGQQREKFEQFIANYADQRDPASDHDRRAYASAGDGSVVALVDPNGRVRFWHTFTAARLPDLRTSDGKVQRMVLTADGRTLAMSADKNKVVSVWDTTTGTNFLRLPPRADFVTSILFSPDGRTLAVAGDDTTVQLRDTRTGELMATLAGHDVPVKAMAFSPEVASYSPRARAPRIFAAMASPISGKT